MIILYFRYYHSLPRPHSPRVSWISLATGWHHFIHNVSLDLVSPPFGSVLVAVGSCPFLLSLSLMRLTVASCDRFTPQLQHQYFHCFHAATSEVVSLYLRGGFWYTFRTLFIVDAIVSRTVFARLSLALNADSPEVTIAPGTDAPSWSTFEAMVS